MAEYEFFGKKDSAQIIQAIKEQGENICREILSRDVILQSLQNADFGYVRFSPLAQIGKKKRGSNTLFVHSFILGKTYFPSDSLFIELVCSRPTARDGGVLMTLMEQYAIENGYKRIFLDAIGDERLKRWYMRQGYKITRTIIAGKDGSVKIWTMIKSLE